MPSWNEKPHITPTINVSLPSAPRINGFQHPPAGGPVPIPCPIPRSATFTVRLGECDCPMSGSARGWKVPENFIHAAQCPSRPIRVSCSISGRTWEESEVTDVIDADRNTDIGWSSDEKARVMAACGARWALVKALVLNQSIGPAYTMVDGIRPLAIHRDAMYAALAKLERADAAAREAHQEAFKALDKAAVAYSTMTPVGSRAADMFAAYVERLIEQVCVLGGES